MDINIPSDKYGPNARTLSLSLTYISVIWIIEPNTHPNPNERMMSFHPRSSPAAAISLTSPKPIPLPFVTKKIKRRKPLTDTKPIT